MSKNNISEFWKRYQASKKKEDEEGVTTSSASASSSSSESASSSSGETKETKSNKNSVSEFWKRYQKEKKKEEIEKTIDFDTFSDDLNTTNATLDGIRGGWKDSGTMATSRASVSNMYKRLSAYEDYRTNYGTEDDNYTDLSELLGVYKSYLDDWDSIAETYGQYDSEDAYNDAIKAWEEEEAKKTRMRTANLLEENSELAYMESNLRTAKAKKDEADSKENAYIDEMDVSDYTDTSHSKGRAGKSRKNNQDFISYMNSIGYSSIEELESAIAEKKAYISEASSLQNDIKLASVADKESNNYDKDFDKKSEYTPIERGFWDKYDGMIDDVYTYINGDDDARSELIAKYAKGGLGSSASTNAMLNAGFEHMTDDEKRLFNYYFNEDREGQTKAKEYWNVLAPKLKDRKESANLASWDEFAHNHKVIGSAISVGANLAAPVEYLSDTITHKLTGELDDNYASRVANTIRGRVSKDVDWNVDLGIIKGDAFDFLYNTTMSGIDSAASVGLYGGLGGVSLGLSSAASATNDALDRGFTDEQALTQGFMSGAFEMLFETISIGRFLDEDVSKGYLKNLATSMFVNATEEGATELANIVYDAFANGDLSNYAVRVQELVDSGVDREEAEKIAKKEFRYQIYEAMGSGALMGGGFTTINAGKYKAYTDSLGKTIRNNENVGNVFDLASVQFSPEQKSAYEAYERYTKKGINADNIKNGKLGNIAHSLGADAEAVLASKNSTPEERAKAERILQDLNAYIETPSVAKYGKGKVNELFGSKDKVDALIENALTKGENTEAYKLATEYKAKLEKGKSLSEAELTKLVDATKGDIKNTTRADAEKKLIELGETENAEGLAKIISKAAVGQKLSSTEIEAIRGNENAINVLSKMDKSSNVELMEVAEGMDKADAELFLETYDGESDIEYYKASFELVSDLAKDNYDADFILEHRGALTPRQVQNIYNKVVAEPRAEQQRKLDELVKKHEGQLVRRANIDDSIFNGAKGQKLWRNLNSRQKKAITFVKAFAKGAGINLKITYNGKYNGKAYNGYYDHETNTIVIDARAGFDRRYISEDAIIPTMSHELTHWMKQKSPELYAKLSKQIFDVFKAKGYTEYDLIATEKQKHPDMSDEDARDEIIAKASEDLFKMSEEGKKIFDSLSEAEKKTLVGKIKEIIKNLVDWANELLGLYESKSDEAGWLREFKDELSEIAKTWDQMLAQAVEVNAAVEAEGTTVKAFAKKTATNTDTQLSAKDNTGRTLSKGQQTYFADSKVRDENGNLKVMYRGDANEFTVFDRKKSKPSNLYGRGFYFTDSKSHAEQYGKATEYYLNIVNPLSPGQNSITKAQMRKFLKAIENNGEDYDLYNYGEGATAETVLKEVWGKDDFLMLQDINAGAIGDFVAAIELFNEVNGTNYDGIIIPTETVIFNSNQAKLTSNLNPTKNADIQFSMKDSVEKTPKLIAVHNVHSNKLPEALDLGGLPMPSIAVIKAGDEHSNFGDVSFVFGRETIEPQADKRNKLYGGDAYTPTRPQVAIKIRESAKDRFSDIYYDYQRKFGDDYIRPLYPFAEYADEEISRMGGIDVAVSRLKDDTKLMQAYLQMQGKKPVEPVMIETETKMDDADVMRSEFFVEALGEDAINAVSKPKGMSLSEHLTEYYNKYGDKLKSAYARYLSELLGFSSEEISNVMANYKNADAIKYIVSARNFLRNGSTNVETKEDYQATQDKIKEAIKGTGYSEWIDGLFDNIVEKKGIRNNKDLYTPSGYRRSFEDLYYEYNLENIVKAMSQGDKKGISAFGGSIFGASTKNYKTVEEARADSDRLKTIDEDEYSRMRSEFFDRLHDISDRLAGGKDSRDAEDMLVEAVAKYTTPTGIKNYLARESKGFYNYTDEIGNEFLELVGDIANMPTGYFEAKPERAVDFSEVKYAVVPDDMDKGLLERLKKVVPDVRPYVSGDNDSRTEVLNSRKDVQLSEKDYPIDTEIQKKVNDAVTNSKNEMHTISEITQAQNNAINRLANTEKSDSFRGKFTGGKHLISNTAIRHTVSEHGDFLREALRAQLPITTTDIARHLSAVKDGKYPSDMKPSSTRQGNPSIVTIYEVNGYTLYAEEITKSLGKNIPSDLIGHTMYKAPTLSTAAFYATSAQTQPKRQDMVLRKYYTTDSTDLSRGNFVSDTKGEPALLTYITENGIPKHSESISGLIALSSDKVNFTDKSKSFGQGYVVCKKPYYITADNRVFSDSKTNVAERINKLKKQGYDCFIFDKVVGDNYMVAVVNKAQIVSDEATFVADEGVQMSEKYTGTSAYDIMGEKKALEKRYNKLAADFENYKERVKLDKTLTKGKVIDPKQLEAVARYLVKYGESDYKASELAKMLNDLYVDLQDGATNDSMTWDEMYAKAYEVAEAIRREAKVRIERPAYYDMILKDIRSARISPNEGQKGDAKHRFGDHYVGKFRGRVTIANDGTPLDEKWSEWASKYPSVFDKDLSPAQQLVELYDIYDDLRNAGEVVQEYEESEVLHSLATEIVNKAWLVTKYESTADKYDKRIKELNFEHRKAMDELKDTYKKKESDAKLLEQMYYGRLINDIKTKRHQDVARAKELGRERLAQYKENAEKKGVVQRITTNSLKLNKMLIDNSKDSHIPEAMKGAVKELLEAIDASSKKWLETGEPTKQDISLNKAFSRLKNVVTDGSEELGDILEDIKGSGLEDTLKEFVKEIDNGAVFFLNEMSIEDLKKLDKIVKIVKTSVNKVNMYHSVLSGLSARTHAADTIKDLEKRTKIYNDDKHHFDKLKTKVYWNNLNPYYAFKNLGGSAGEIFTAFQNAQDKLAFLAKEVIDFADGLYTGKEYKKWSETYFEFSIPQPSGKIAKFSMNVPQIMSLYCVIKQEDAKKHILHGDENGEGGGITIAETKDKRAVRQNIRITEDDLKNIISKLDDKSVIKAKGGSATAVADKLQEYMGTRGAELGNEITMARWGIKSFGIENYFPIKVSEGAVPQKGDAPGDVSMSMLQLLNASFTHSRNHMSKKSVEIGDVFDVFSNHMSNMVRYNTFALPILDMYKWINYKNVTEAGEEISVQGAVKEAFGDYAWGYLQTFLKDVSGASKSDTRDNLAVKFFKNSKVAKVAGNMRVALLQFTSFIRAGAVMDNKYLLHALHHKPKIQRSEEKCGIVLWKALGYYDTDITRGLTDKIKHDENLKDKVVGLSLKGAELADKVTMGVLWNACELEIRDTRKGLKVGSDEFNEAVALRLRDVIYKTQVVDSMLTRSQMMRSPSGWDKMLTTFASESTLSLNLMTDIFVSTQLEAIEFGRKEARQKNGKYIRKTIAAYAVTNIVTSVLQSVFDAFRDYDEDDKDEEYWAKLMLENFAVNSSMFAKIPYINLFVSTLQGFTASRADTDWMNSTVKAGKEIYKLMSGSGDPEKLLRYMLKAGSDVTGIAAYNVYRDVVAFYMFLTGNGD